MSDFHDPDEASGYGARTRRLVPALPDLHRMAGVLLAERMPDDGRLLVLGAGGGLELRAFAEAQPGWRFDGVDPSAAMLDQARSTLGPLADRVVLHEGLVDSAPAGPFDGATCLLTLHFLPAEERLATLQELAARMRPGAPLVVAHHSFATRGGRHDLWLRRNAELLIRGGMPREQAERGAAAMKAKLPILSPDRDEALLRQAGFADVELFFVALTLRGWVAVRRGA